MNKGHKSEAFGRLYRGALKAIAAFESCTEAAIEQEFGDAVGVAPATIQRYKQGLIPELPAVEQFAEAAVYRGFFNREWLARFLRAARHPDAPRVIGWLCPAAPTNQSPPRALDNLPPPAYTAFVMRPHAFRQVLDGLQQRNAVVAIISLGGMGKSSLALEAASYCLGKTASRPEFERPLFEAAVWISDKDQLGSTRLSTVLDAIAMTLGYPGCTSLDLHTKRSEVDSMLRNKRVLVIVDNFETITDDHLLEWLLHLPEPSKALITTRQYRREFQRGVWLVEPGGMDAAEAGRLIEQRARQLNLPPLIDAPSHEYLIRLTGGNPRAIELIVGQVKFAHRSLNNVLDGFTANDSDLLNELFAQSWILLTAEARLLLQTATLFVTSTGSRSLAAISGLPHDIVVQSMRQLFELALADVVPSPGGDLSRLALHPLTRVFLTSRTDLAVPMAALQQRWLHWCVAFAEQHGGYRIFDVEQLAVLDHEETTLFAAAQQAYEQGLDAETIRLAKSLEFYYYVRAHWSKKLELHRWYIAAAARSGAVAEEINALALHIQLLSRQGHLQEADRYMPRLEELIQQEPLQGVRAFHYHHTRGHYLLARAQGDLASLQAAAGHWQWLIDHPEHLDDLMLQGAQHWLATCLARQGLADYARTMFETALTEARDRQVARFVARNQLGLAQLDLDAGNLVPAGARITEVRSLTSVDDWEQLARLAAVEGRLCAGQGNAPEALHQFDQAIRLFARMGLISDRTDVERQRSGIMEQELTER
jgi:tetratricopeptide (TPR) repeat protein